MSDEAEAAKVVSAAGVVRLLGAIFGLVVAVATGAFYIAGMQARLDEVEEDVEECKTQIADHKALKIHPMAQGMVDGIRLEISHMHADRDSDNQAILEAIKNADKPKRRRR